MRFEKTSVMNFKNALRSMRNPKNSWNRNDTDEICIIKDDMISYLDNGFVELPCSISEDDSPFAVMVRIGENDMKLAQTLIKAGSEHRKFLRQIFVCVDITAPLYWWKEFDTYKVGTVANSTSTMHKITSQEITMDCFDIDDLSKEGGLDRFMVETVNKCEELRKAYLETNEIRYWKELIRLLPSGWLQTRTVTMNYENLFGMCSKGQRRFHKLNEWSGIHTEVEESFIQWARTLPYAQELIFIDEI